MKILYVSNYSPWILVSKGLMPSNHLFGIKEVLCNLFLDKNGVWHGDFNGGSVTFICVKSGSIKNVWRYYVQAFKYDIVYDVLNSVSKYLGLIPSCFRPFKLVTILHHPPFDKQLKLSDSDVYIFFSQKLKDIAQKSFPLKQHKMFLNEWKPDLNYYLPLHKVDTIYDFLDCGRTNRDHKTIVEALQLSKSKGLFFDKKNMTSQTDYDLFEGIHTFFYKENFIPDEMYVELIKCCRTMILALPISSNVLGPLGATVIMDALGLEMPIICSDNAYCADMILDNGLGLVFKAGDAEDLAQCMVKLKDSVFYEKCRKNIANYNNVGGGINMYSQNVFRIFRDVLTL